jgi:3-oxoacyl-[acyl-carrier-protein] synthase-3
MSTAARRPQTVGHLRMEGREVFKHAVGMITDVIYDAFAATGITADDIDWLVPHQANRRIIDASAQSCIPAGEGGRHGRPHGNTSAASIPLALAEAVARRAHQEGDLVLLEAMGGGFTWGSALWCAGKRIEDRFIALILAPCVAMDAAVVGQFGN